MNKFTGWEIQSITGKDLDKEFVAVDDIFDFIEEQINKGNIKPHGFSPAICLSDLKKKLSQKKLNDYRKIKQR